MRALAAAHAVLHAAPAAVPVMPHLLRSGPVGASARVLVREPVPCGVPAGVVRAGEHVPAVPRIFPARAGRQRRLRAGAGPRAGGRKCGIKGSGWGGGE